MKRDLTHALIISIALAAPLTALAMHISEGYLPLMWCLIWGAAALPFAAIGLRKIAKLTSDEPRLKMLLALAGAFAFMLSAFKIPSVTGSCSHMTGTGLGATLFGPFAAAVTGVIVLIFQALLLAHGGLSTLGANASSMAIVGPFVSYGLWKLLKDRINPYAAMAIACFAGSLCTYALTSFQLALAYPKANLMAEFAKYSAIFVATQLPLSVVEGLLSMLVYSFLTQYCANELKTLNALPAKMLKKA